MSATTTNKRRDYGEWIPGARKDRAEKLRDAMGDLAEMRDSGRTFTSAQVQAKLTEIRRDDIWGPLEDKLEELKNKQASPALALAWRTLYETVAASAGSTQLKPGYSSFGIGAEDAYIFSACYKAILEQIDKNMADLPDDVTWPEINATVLACPRSSYPMHGLSGPAMVSDVRLDMSQAQEVPEAKPSVESAVSQWLSGLGSRPVVPYPVYLVAKKSRYPDPLQHGKCETWDKYVPSWRSEAQTLAEQVIEKAGIVSNSTKYDVMASLVRNVTEGRERAEHASRLSPEDKEAIEAAYGEFELLPGEFWTRIENRAELDPWTTVKQRKAEAEKKTEGEFESVVTPKVMPIGRFEHLKREAKPGAPSPRQGDVSEEDLMALVPFRGIQYGNWATQAERQEMLNMAYDAMNDLALALEVSPKYLALTVKDGSGGKNLGLALGARGRGGRAVAHYEPREHVVNLTKTKGGGSLAHEWMHAYDHKMASDLGLSIPFASDVKGNQINDFVKRLSRLSEGDDYSQHRETITSIKLTAMTEMLLTPDIEKRLFEASGSAESWKSFGEAALKTLSTWAQVNSPVLDYACSNNASGRFIIDPDVISSNMRQGFKDNGVPETAAGVLAETWSRSVSSSTWISLHKRTANRTANRYGKTAYLLNAEILDATRSKPYWSSSVELFARAGSAVVFNRLRAVHGISNGFLDESSNPKNFDPHTHKADENPAGAEREAFSKAFTETLMADMRKQDAELNVAVETSPRLKVGQLRLGI